MKAEHSKQCLETPKKSIKESDINDEMQKANLIRR
jgi:hypothetical protein